MDQDLVTDARVEAGREYIAALSDLGFVPEGALWSVREFEPDTLELSLFSSIVDRIGPRAVLDALFAAYDKALTPRNFDPWDVSVYSPGMRFYECFAGHPQPPGKPARGTFRMGGETAQFDEHNRLIGFFAESASRIAYQHWIYLYPSQKKQAAVPQLKSWHRFEERIAKAA